MESCRRSEDSNEANGTVPIKQEQPHAKQAGTDSNQTYPSRIRVTPSVRWQAQPKQP